MPGLSIYPVNCWELI
ncbi:hypothetical protein LINPERHAP1_LOCUS15611 [Linum perenne]